MTPLTKILDGNDIENFQKYIAHYKPDNQHISNYTSDQSLLAIIGPEGDFTPEELEACLAQNFVSVNISNNRLRTETAAVVTTQYLVDKVNIKL